MKRLYPHQPKEREKKKTEDADRLLKEFKSSYGIDPISARDLVNYWEKMEETKKKRLDLDYPIGKIQFWC